ncbi:MAG: hypothetical protein ACI9DQ_001803, partial [Glaciecola sp.]
MRNSFYWSKKLSHTLTCSILVFSSSLLVSNNIANAQPTPPSPLSYTDSELLHEIAKDISAARIEQDIRTLVSFGTRHTLSETESETRGIGAARRWIKEEFDKI